MLEIKECTPLSKSNNIILIGMMGTGKSTVADLLARELGYKLIDVDTAVEKEEGCTIPELFTSKGESYFRDAESRMLCSVLEKKSQVVATGGGVVLRSDNCDVMSKNGWIVALTADPAAIVQRVSGDDKRPLLAGNAEERIHTIMKERKDAYKFAHYTVDTTELSAAEVSRLILAHYRV
ncbi:AAA family ATPase [Paenibacillus sp. P13VS]|nr:AAA family ATPase [Paenibacillus sp. P13VS]MBY0216586.1 shikimate kinase [Paenibacillus illinoisensis]